VYPHDLQCTTSSGLPVHTGMKNIDKTFAASARSALELQVIHGPIDERTVRFIEGANDATKPKNILLN